MFPVKRVGCGNGTKMGLYPFIYSGTKHRGAQCHFDLISCVVSWTKMEKPSLCVEAPRLEGKTDKESQCHGTGPLSVLSKILLPCPPVPCVRCSLYPGQKQQWDEKALSSGGPRFTLKDSSLGCPGPVFLSDIKDPSYSFME